MLGSVQSTEKMYSVLKSWHTAFYHNIKGQGILTMPMSYKDTFFKKSKHPFEEKKLLMAI